MNSMKLEKCRREEIYVIKLFILEDIYLLLEEIHLQGKNLTLEKENGNLFQDMAIILLII